MPIEITRSDDLDETRTSDGKVIARIDYVNMSKETALALKQYDINNELNNREFIQTNQDENINSLNDMNSQAIGQSMQNENAKVLTKNNGHSILGNDKDYPNGFSNRLLISLLAGFGLGVIAATIYIFTNLSKATIIIS